MQACGGNAGLLILAAFVYQGDWDAGAPSLHYLSLYHARLAYGLLIPHFGRRCSVASGLRPFD